MPYGCDGLRASSQLHERRSPRADRALWRTVFIAIIVFLALMLLIPVWRTAIGAKFARKRAVEIGAPTWIAWMVGMLTGGAVLTGAFLGGAGHSVWKAACAVILSVGLGSYMMWRAGFRRASRGADHSSPNQPRT